MCSRVDPVRNKFFQPPWSPTWIFEKLLSKHLFLHQFFIVNQYQSHKNRRTNVLSKSPTSNLMLKMVSKIDPFQFTFIRRSHSIFEVTFICTNRKTLKHSSFSWPVSKIRDRSRYGLPHSVVLKMVWPLCTMYMRCFCYLFNGWINNRFMLSPEWALLNCSCAIIFHRSLLAGWALTPNRSVFWLMMRVCNTKTEKRKRKNGIGNEPNKRRKKKTVEKCQSKKAKSILKYHMTLFVLTKILWCKHAPNSV